MSVEYNNNNWAFYFLVFLNFIFGHLILLHFKKYWCTMDWEKTGPTHRWCEKLRYVRYQKTRRQLGNDKSSCFT